MCVAPEPSSRRREYRWGGCSIRTRRISNHWIPRPTAVARIFAGCLARRRGPRCLGDELIRRGGFSKPMAAMGPWMAKRFLPTSSRGRARPMSRRHRHHGQLADPQGSWRAKQSKPLAHASSIGRPTCRTAQEVLPAPYLSSRYISPGTCFGISLIFIDFNPLHRSSNRLP
jgi:hypothetical protein